MNNHNIFTAQYWSQQWHIISERALHSTLQVIGLVIAYLIIRFVLFRLLDSCLVHLLDLVESSERTARLETIRGLITSMLSYLLLFIFGALLLNAIGFNIIPFVETAGVVGLAIGFGAQKLVKDVISGFFLIVDNQFTVGETVTIGTVNGVVEQIGMRVTRIRDAGGRIYLIANGDIGTIVNLSRNPIIDFVEISLAAGADLNKSIALLNEVGTKMMEQRETVLRQPPTVQGITAFTAASTTIRISIACDPQHLADQQMHLRAALREALLKADIPLA